MRVREKQNDKIISPNMDKNHLRKKMSTNCVVYSSTPTAK